MLILALNYNISLDYKDESNSAENSFCLGREDA